MTFEEFFKKKRIDLDALQKAEAGLFSEFRTHYTEMGEKSFDHTKKYWFNKLRRKFPLAVEIKTEKPKIANPLAEQTITESLEELSAPKPGFVPRFKAANVQKTAEETSPENKIEETSAASIPKPAFTPRFKAANMPKPVSEQQEKTQDNPAEPSAAVSPENTETKPVYKPRFNPKNIPKKDE